MAALAVVLLLVPGLSVLVVPSRGLTATPRASPQAPSDPWAAVPRAPVGGMDRAGVRGAEVGSPPRWIDAAPSSGVQLPILEEMAATWDGADGYLLVTDGDSDSGLFDRSWSYASGNWTVLSTSGGLGALEGHDMVYDPAAGEVVLFGGLRSVSPLEYNNTTWTYRAGVWTPHTGGRAPPARFGASMVYDAALGGVLLFGGLNLSDTSQVLGDLWLYRDGNWTELNATGGPSARWLAQMAYDPSLGAAVIFGGATVSEAELGGTWLFENDSWTALPSNATAPPALAAGFMAYDADLGAVLLTDGVNASGDLPNATWAYGADGWSEIPTVGSNGGRFDGVAAWDPLDHELLLVGGNESSAETLALVQPLTIPSLGAPARTDVGRWTSFVPTIDGGPRPIRFAWTFDGSPGNLTANASFRPLVSGALSVGLAVTGADGSQAFANVTVTVVAGPSVTIAPLPSTVDLGSRLTLVARPAGGVGPYAVDWSFGDGTNATGANVSHAWEEEGPQNVAVRLTDAAGASASATAWITVVTGPTIAFNGSFPPAEAGVPVSFGSTVANGTGPFRIAWSFGDGATGAGFSATHAYASAGSYEVGVSVLDADGEGAGVGGPIAVAPPLTASILAPPSLVAGSSATWRLTITGGVAPYRIAWAFPGGIASASPEPNETFESAGPRSVVVWVNDSAGGSVRTIANVTVAGGPSGGSSSDGTLLAIGGIGVAGVVLVAAAAYSVARRRRRGPR